MKRGKRSNRRKSHLNKTKAGELLKKGCTSKKKYNNEMDALAWGRYSNDKRSQHIKFGAYFCSVCYNWHLTDINKSVTSGSH